ncbi:unnamed protein product, partial [marine sediment metagenome]
IEGQPGNFTVTLKKRPRYIDEEKCTSCALCVNNCPVRNIIYTEPEKEELKLSDGDLKRVRVIINNYKDKKGTLVPILQDISSQFSSQYFDNTRSAFDMAGSTQTDRY